MPKIGSTPTVKDVAQEAGVAIGTVSKVINGLPVGESYRKRVEDAIEKLGYRVNFYAKGLKSNRTYTIAVLVPNLVNPYFCKLVSNLNRVMTQRGYQMMIFCTDYDPNIEQEFVTMAEQKRVDGIICLSYNPQVKVTEGIPFVSIDRYFGGDIPCVASDNFGGGWIAAERLVKCGCKHLAFLRVGSKLTNEPNKRKEGFIQACEQLGVPYDLKIIDDGTPHTEFEDFLREHYVDGKMDIDGIFCVTDSLACNTIKLLEKMGLRVPEDVSVVGFDGMQKFGDQEYYCSTIVQPVDKIAAACVDLILNEKNDTTPALMCLPVQYAYGGTTKESYETKI